MEKKIEITDKELARIRPSRLVKAFNSNPAIIFLKLSSVNYIRSFLSVFWYYVVRTEPWRGSS